MKHEKFAYASIAELIQKMEELNLQIPLSEDMTILGESITVEGRIIPNRLAIQPMEGCDGTLEGAPSDLTKRRYERFAKSGVGLIWFEAVAVVREGKANPRQLMLTQENKKEYQELIHHIKATCQEQNGFTPLIIMQMTHSGRYSKPDIARPLIAAHNEVLEKTPLEEACIVSDDYLKGLEKAYVSGAKLAEEVGFDGVDVKACHGYLLNELLHAYTRPGIYGGSFENRIRMLCQTIAKVKAAVSRKMIVTTRMNVYDALKYPFGWGVNKEDFLMPDLREPIALIRKLYEEYDIHIVNLTVGNPYFNPHVNRPYDKGAYEPPYHALESLERIARCIGEIKKACPNVTIISSAHSYLRHLAGEAAAGMIKSGCADIAGFGREAFAYPMFAKDLLNLGKLDPKKCCITCSKCTELMRNGAVAGCVIYDQEVYGPIYKEKVLKTKKDVKALEKDKA